MPVLKKTEQAESSEEKKPVQEENTINIENEKKKKTDQKRKKEKKEKKPKKKKPYFGFGLTAALIFTFFFIFALLWSLFISGPSRLHDAKVSERIAVIKEQVPAIQGIEETTFEYITYQGYTTDTLYWFDETGQIITTRELSTLDYNKARQTASETYGIDPVSVQLAFGYTSPVYEVQGENSFLLLNYDTFEKVYER